MHKTGDIFIVAIRNIRNLRKPPAALARMHGEALARQKINGLTALFEDLLSRSLIPRANSLAG